MLYMGWIWMWEDIYLHQIWEGQKFISSEVVTVKMKAASVVVVGAGHWVHLSTFHQKKKKEQNIK